MIKINELGGYFERVSERDAGSARRRTGGVKVAAILLVVGLAGVFKHVIWQ